MNTCHKHHIDYYSVCPDCAANRPAPLQPPAQPAPIGATGILFPFLGKEVRVQLFSDSVERTGTLDTVKLPYFVLRTRVGYWLGLTEDVAVMEAVP